MQQFILFFGLIFLSTTPWAESTGYPLQRVEDGDTLVVKIDGQPLRLQLLGIDAPEDVENPKLKKDMERTGLDKEVLLNLGRDATNHLKGLVVPGTGVTLSGDLNHKDRYGRILIIAYTPEGDSLNETMVENGYAITLGRYPMDEALQQQLTRLEAAAREGHHGLWGLKPDTMEAWSRRF